MNARHWQVTSSSAASRSWTLTRPNAAWPNCRETMASAAGIPMCWQSEEAARAAADSVNAAINKGALPKFTFLLEFRGNTPARTQIWSGVDEKDAREICFANLGGEQDRLWAITTIANSGVEP